MWNITATYDGTMQIYGQTLEQLHIYLYKEVSIRVLFALTPPILIYKLSSLIVHHGAEN